MAHLSTLQNLRAPEGSDCEVDQILVPLAKGTWEGCDEGSGRAFHSSPSDSAFEYADTSPVYPTFHIYTAANHRYQRCLPYDQGYRPHPKPQGRRCQSTLAQAGASPWHNTFEFSFGGHWTETSFYPCWAWAGGCLHVCLGTCVPDADGGRR